MVKNHCISIGLYKNYNKDRDFLNYIQNNKALCLPLLNSDGEVRGFIPYELYDGVIRDSVDKSLAKDKEYKELYDYCMVKQGEDEFPYFNANRCVNKLNDFLKQIKQEEYEEEKAETEENTIDLLKNVFGE